MSRTGVYTRTYYGGTDLVRRAIPDYVGDVEAAVETLITMTVRTTTAEAILHQVNDRWNTKVTAVDPSLLYSRIEVTVTDDNGNKVVTAHPRTAELTNRLRDKFRVAPATA